MFHLLLTACLATDPGACQPIVLPAGMAQDRDACMESAERIAAEWLATHKGLTAGAPECRPTAALEKLSVQEIAPGVYVHIGALDQIKPENAGRIANLGFVVGDSVAVIDAGASRAEGQALYATIRSVTDKPISHLILTHMHPDHVLGAEVFAEVGATIIAHPAMADALAMRAGTYMDNMDWIAGKAAMIGTAITPPDEVATAGTVIDLGSTRLTLVPVETAHTDNDLLVHDEASNTLFAGDLLFRRLTPVVDGSINGWLSWMAEPTAPDPTIIVPGHGPVAATWDEAASAQRDFLAALRDATRARIAEGLPMSRAVPAILQDLEPLAGNWIDYEATVRRNATAAYKELEWE